MHAPDVAMAERSDHARTWPWALPRTLAARLGLRSKGWIALASLFAYLGMMCLVVVLQREATVRAFDGIETIRRAGQELDRLSKALAVAAADLPGFLQTTRAGRVPELTEDLHRAMETGGATAGTLRDARRSVAALDATVRAYHAAPTGDRAAQVERQLDEALRAIDRAAAQVSAEHDARSAGFRADRLIDAATLVAIGFVGIVVLGAGILLFVTRIRADLTALRLRTAEIVAGRRPRPMPVTRFDEVGELSATINELAVALRKREHDLELERRKGFHREKMAAIGSLAAGVLTEIGNPIAAIDGFARAMRETRGSGGSGPQQEACSPETILEQTARLTVIAHQIAEFTAPQPSHRQLVDINVVVESALGLLRFDDAMRAIDIELALDRQLPAVPGMTDRLVQLLMNLIGNATDALRDRPKGEARLRITTGRVEDGIALEVRDNGIGMSDEVRDRAFEPFFSTKPAGRGTGLGLPLCQSIVEDHGGRIQLRSASDLGTRITITLPLASADYGAETRA